MVPVVLRELSALEFFFFLNEARDNAKCGVMLIFGEI